MRSDNIGKPAREGRNHCTRVIDRQRRLGRIGKIILIVWPEALDIFRGLNQGDRALWQLPEPPGNFRMTGIAAKEAMASLAMMALTLPVHLRHQRAGCVDGEDVA